MHLLVFVEEPPPGVQEHTCSKHHKLITPWWLLLFHLQIAMNCMVLIRIATVGTDEDEGRQSLAIYKQTNILTELRLLL